MFLPHNSSFIKLLEKLSNTCTVGIGPDLSEMIDKTTMIQSNKFYFIRYAATGYTTNAFMLLKKKKTRAAERKRERDRQKERCYSGKELWLFSNSYN